MANPTLVVLTDRNDLDDQLFATFSMCRDLIRQTPVQAESRDDLQKVLSRASGGVIFTTLQKFGEISEPLTTRRNVVVIADEAHRSQYGFKAKVDAKTGEISYGFAKYMRDALPNASFIGFTGTPIEADDVNTPAVFGHYIDVYDISRAVEDGAPASASATRSPPARPRGCGWAGRCRWVTTCRTACSSSTRPRQRWCDGSSRTSPAIARPPTWCAATRPKATVPIYYESRLARIELDEDEKPKIDAEVNELTEEDSEADQERFKKKWSTVEALVGSDKRLALVAKDMVAHFEDRVPAGLAGRGGADGAATGRGAVRLLAARAFTRMRASPLIKGCFNAGVCY